MGPPGGRVELPSDFTGKKEPNAVFDFGLAEARSDRKLNAVRLPSVGKLLIRGANGTVRPAPGTTGNSGKHKAKPSTTPGRENGGGERARGKIIRFCREAGIKDLISILGREFIARSDKCPDRNDVSLEMS